MLAQIGMNLELVYKDSRIAGACICCEAVGVPWTCVDLLTLSVASPLAGNIHFFDNILLYLTPFKVMFWPCDSMRKSEFAKGLGRSSISAWLHVRS